jgi:ABC-type glutathione transport system ATPase component
MPRKAGRRRKETEAQRDSSASARKLPPMVLLRVENLQVHFPIRNGFGKRDVVKAVDDVNFQIEQGKRSDSWGRAAVGSPPSPAPC